MKTKDIRTQGKTVINTIFSSMIASDKKEDWKKGISFIQKKIYELENGNRGEELFIWRSVLNQVTDLFGTKFIGENLLKK